MKKISCIILLLCATLMSFSQTDTDYESFVENITKAINTKEVKSVYELFTSDLKKEIPAEEFEKVVLNYQKELGQITSTEFWMEGELGNCYLLEFEKASMVLILKLTPEKKISVCTIEEY